MNFFLAFTTGCCLALFGAANWFATLPFSSQWLIVAWMVMLGGCFGSFMNVVIYRVPAGLSVVHPGSRCPKCLHEIRGYDNIPVLSWLILRGRCRDCGVPISMRYPVIEALVALVFLALAVADVLSGGVTLTPRLTFDATNLSNSVVQTFSDADLWGVFACHSLFICTLICAALIEYDGHAPPRHLFYLTLAVSLVAMLAAPGTTAMRVSEPAVFEPGEFIAQVVLSILYGAGLGLVLVPIARRWNPVHQQRSPLLMTMASCGLVLGAHAVLLIAMTTALVTIIGGLLVARRTSGGRVPVLGCVATLSFVTIIGWHQIIEPNLLPLVPEKLVRSELGIAVALVTLVILALVTSLTNPDTSTLTPASSAAKEIHT